MERSRETTSQILDNGALLTGEESLDLPAIANAGAVGGGLNIVTGGLGTLISPTITSKVGKVFNKSTQNAISKAQAKVGDAVKKRGGTKAEFQSSRKTAKSNVRNAANAKVTHITQNTVMTTNAVAKKGAEPAMKKRKNE